MRTFEVGGIKMIGEQKKIKDNDIQIDNLYIKKKKSHVKKNDRESHHIFILQHHDFARS